MKLKKRKIKYAVIFCICWFVFLVILVDGVLKFQTLVDYFGSYALVEITLLLLVILPTLAVYRLTKEDKTMSLTAAVVVCLWLADFATSLRAGLSPCSRCI